MQMAHQHDHNDDNERILVVGLSWIGDMVMSQSLYKSLKQQDSSVEIDVVAPVWSKDLLYRMPEVSKVFELHAGHGELNLSARYRLGVVLRTQRYKQAIILPRTFKSALLPCFASIPVRTGYRGEMRYGLINDMRPLDKVRLSGMVERMVNLGYPAGTSVDDLEIINPQIVIDKHHRKQCVNEFALNTRQEIIALFPGSAYGKAKQWPPDYFAQVADYHIKKDREIWIFGSQSDHVIGEEIVHHSVSPQSVINLCGKTSIRQAIDLISYAAYAVTNDSGLMHVAAAIGCPTIVIYGSTSPLYAPPMTHLAHILYTDIECSPCRKRTCRYGHYRCLTEIAPEQVIEQGKRFFAPHTI